MGYRQRSGGKRDKGEQSRGEGRTGMGEAEGEDPSRLTPPTHTPTKTSSLLSCSVTPSPGLVIIYSGGLATY